MALELLQVGARVSDWCESTVAEVPLVAAIKAGHVNMVAMLLSHGAAVDPPSWDHSSPLYYATKRNMPEVTFI